MRKRYLVKKLQSKWSWDERNGLQRGSEGSSQGEGGIVEFRNLKYSRNFKIDKLGLEVVERMINREKKEEQGKGTGKARAKDKVSAGSPHAAI